MKVYKLYTTLITNKVKYLNMHQLSSISINMVSHLKLSALRVPKNNPISISTYHKINVWRAVSKKYKKHWDKWKRLHHSGHFLKNGNLKQISQIKETKTKTKQKNKIFNPNHTNNKILRHKCRRITKR